MLLYIIYYFIRYIFWHFLAASRVYKIQPPKTNFLHIFFPPDTMWVSASWRWTTSSVFSWTEVGLKLLPHRDLHRFGIASKSRWSTTRSEEYRAYTWCASGVCSSQSLVNIYFLNAQTHAVLLLARGVNCGTSRVGKTKKTKKQNASNVETCHFHTRLQAAKSEDLEILIGIAHHFVCQSRAGVTAVVDLASRSADGEIRTAGSYNLRNLSLKMLNLQIKVLRGCQLGWRFEVWGELKADCYDTFVNLTSKNFNFYFCRKMYYLISRLFTKCIVPDIKYYPWIPHLLRRNSKINCTVSSNSH